MAAGAGRHPWRRRLRSRLSDLTSAFSPASADISKEVGLRPLLKGFMPARCVWLHGVARRFALLLLPRSPASAPAPASSCHAKASVPSTFRASERRTALAGLASPHPAGASSVTAGCDLLSAAAKTVMTAGQALIKCAGAGRMPRPGGSVFRAGKAHRGKKLSLLKCDRENWL